MLVYFIPQNSLLHPVGTGDPETSLDQFGAIGYIEVMVIEAPF